MIEWLRSVGAGLARRPGWQLVAGALLLALAFPSRAAGTIGALIVAGALGVAVAGWWQQLPRWLRSPPDRLASALVIAIVVGLGLSTLWDVLATSPDWQMGDWGPQHAALRGAMPALPGLDLPVWNHAAGTGDAPFELYPKLAYLVTGHLALALGLDADLPRAMMVVAVIVHLGIAAATTAIAMRIAPRPIALVVGVIAILDGGAVAHGGTVGLFRWALLHSAMALAFTTVAALGVLAALRRPRLAASAAIWLGTAAACATHPAGLIAAVAAVLALAAVALLASDVPPRRALAAIAHVGLGVALGAALWMPLAARILDYGQHYPNPIRSPARLVEDLLAWVSPVTWYSMLGYAGYFGILAGLWSRRAAPVFVSAGALVLLVGLCDAPYLALDLAPGQAVARLGTERLAQLARPLLAAAGGYAIAVLAGHVIAAWRGAGPQRRLIAAALIGMLSLSLLRVVPPVLRSASSRALDETRWLAADPIGRAGLVDWAGQRARELRPDAWARALFETDTHEHFHLTALTGLPTLHDGPQPDLLLRERIEDVSPASLRRYNVRWVIAADRSPALGDADRELVIGSFHIRELAGWDGQFARIERGTGELRVTRLDDRAVELEVIADAPVLVALGTGYYPRWRARHASGADQPVYPLRATQHGKLHVVSAWLAPGRTTFTADGPLPSDGDGRAPTALAALAMIAIVAIWRTPRWRRRALRRMAAVRRWLTQRLPLMARVGAPLALFALLVRGCNDAGGPARSLELGSGVRATAAVSARVAGGSWRECDYERLTGSHVCDGLLVANDGMVNLLNDAAPSWAFTTPGILASAERPDVEIRIRLAARLHGSYWVASDRGGATLEVSGEHGREVDRAIISYEDRGVRDIEIRAAVPTTTWALTFVRDDTLVPPRRYLVEPPPSAPPRIRGIR